MCKTVYNKPFWDDEDISLLERYRQQARGKRGIPAENLKTLRPKKQNFSIQSGSDFVELFYHSATPSKGDGMATKKAAKKAGAKKTAPASTRGNTYVSTGDGRKKFAEMSGQGKIVADGLLKHEPITSSALAEKVGGSLETKQEPGRVVGFYLSQWKADGLVKNGPKPAAAA